MDNILKATVAQVSVGAITVEGLFLETGCFGISVLQANELISFSASKNTASRDLRRLLGNNFNPSKAKIQGLRQLINYVLLKDFEKLLFELALTGNQKAIEFSRALIGLSLQQLFSDAFNIQFEKEDRQRWLKARMSGKATRRSLTDAIKAWYERNPNKSSRPMGLMIAQTTNAIYQELWRMDALEIESLLNCGRNESRDSMSSECLKILDRAEANVIDFIDDDNIKPIDAVPLARIRKAKVSLK